MNPPLMWRPRSVDMVPMLLIALLPLLLALPQLIGWLHADPMLYLGSMARNLAPGGVPGLPFADPNAGYTAQALGYRAAMEWMRGEVPWWNPYSGVGLPLAAEYQPAVFFPPTLLLLLPNGMVWEHILLQVLAGWGTYALLRQLGLARVAATTGGLLYAFNGTLAWFADAPAFVAPFLPWMLLGVERAWAATGQGLPGSWRVLALAMAMSLLAGFPESAYIDGLLALAWAVLRGVQTDAGRRGNYAARIVLGGGVALLLAAPQLLAFLEFLPLADIGEHGSNFAFAALGPHAFLPTLIAPYVFGPVSGYSAWGSVLSNMWGSMGGYVSIIILIVAAYGFLARRNALAWLLLAWFFFAIEKTFRLEPGLTLWNLVPGVTLTAFARYAQPSWELALIILATFGIDQLAKKHVPRRGTLVGTALVAAALLGWGLYYGAHLWPSLHGNAELLRWTRVSMLWATLSTLAVVALLTRVTSSRAAGALAVMIAVEGMVLFAIPTYSNARSGSIDLPAIRFLRENLGLQRFYTLGPIQPNYGAYFGIASINHNYIPVVKRWSNWVKSRLDNSADTNVFNGNRPRATSLPTQAHELRRNLASYEWVGVRYVVAPTGQEPFDENGGAESETVIGKVYADDLMDIFELPDPKPYFEVLDGTCAIVAHGRTYATVDCPAGGTLIRRELYFPGWTASVRGKNVQIAEHGGLFQAVALPVGLSNVRFHYAPPYAQWAWLAVGLGLAICLVTPRRPFGHRG